MGIDYIELKPEQIAVPDWIDAALPPFLKTRITALIRKRGILENLIVREFKKRYSLVHGIEILTVAKELGIKRLQCCNMGRITEAQAKRVSVEMTETRFPTNPIKVGKLLEDLVSSIGEEELLTMAPLTKDQLQFAIDEALTEWKPEDVEKKRGSRTTSTKPATEIKEIRIELTPAVRKAWEPALRETGTENHQTAFEKVLRSYV